MVESPPAKSTTAIFNLIFLIFTGISVSWWILYFTSWFPVFGGLLGLGGLFSWIAFVGNILTDQRKKELQEIFDYLFLQRPFLAVSLILFLGCWWLGLAPRCSTLLVDGLGSTAGHIVEVLKVKKAFSVDSSPVARFKVSPHDTARVLLFTPWFNSATYRVKVSGYPAGKIKVQGCHREIFFIPEMLLERPVALIRPKAMDSGVVSSDFSLEVLLNDDKAPVCFLPDYHGQSLWLGTDSDVDVPQSLIDKWHLEFKIAGLDERFVGKWLRPEVCPSVLELPGSTKIIVNLKNRDGAICYTAQHIIQASGKARKFPEEIILHEQQ